jgi:hypothetical protein
MEYQLSEFEVTHFHKQEERCYVCLGKWIPTTHAKWMPREKWSILSSCSLSPPQTSTSSLHHTLAKTVVSLVVILP